MRSFEIRAAGKLACCPFYFLNGEYPTLNLEDVFFIYSSLILIFLLLLHFSCQYHRCGQATSCLMSLLCQTAVRGPTIRNTESQCCSNTPDKRLRERYCCSHKHKDKSSFKRTIKAQFYPHRLVFLDWPSAVCGFGEESLIRRKKSSLTDFFMTDKLNIQTDLKEQQHFIQFKSFYLRNCNRQMFDTFLSKWLKQLDNYQNSWQAYYIFDRLTDLLINHCSSLKL